MKRVSHSAWLAHSRDAGSVQEVGRRIESFVRVNPVTHAALEGLLIDHQISPRQFILANRVPSEHRGPTSEPRIHGPRTRRGHITRAFLMFRG